MTSVNKKALLDLVDTIVSHLHSLSSPVHIMEVLKAQILSGRLDEPEQDLDISPGGGYSAELDALHILYTGTLRELKEEQYYSEERVKSFHERLDWADHRYDVVKTERDKLLEIAERYVPDGWKVSVSESEDYNTVKQIKAGNWKPE